ncbi:MAG: hypothetical protein EOO89_05270 [Pedobacter sp.]|nr:MAG: hypothetical protein EOO89_05270 [Pedobacter sp.]
MVSKKILGVAIAAAFSTQAFAALDLTAGTGGVGTGAVTIAKESVTNAQVVGGFVQATSATQFDTTVALGFGVSAGSHAFIRVDLTNAKFIGAVTAGSVTFPTKTVTTDYVVQVAQGGAIGDSYVILDITAVTALTQAQTLVLDLTGMQVSPSAPATLSFAHYSTSPAAVTATATNTSGALSTDTYAFATVAPVLTTAITATNNVADVNASPAFTAFTGATNVATLGNVKFTLAAGATDATGTAVTALNQVIDTSATKSKLAVTGDLSFIGITDAATTATKLTFGGVNADTATPAASLASTGTLSTLTGITLGGAGNNIIVTGNPANVMNAADYTLTFTPTPITNAAYPPAPVSGSLGSITRNGTTIQVPYVTTFSDYNQRLVLVNRSSLSAPYKITFTPEAGVTATAGTAATGTLAPGKTLIVKATDIVTLTGATRTAATIVITAPTTTIDAATTSVNLSDKSTDTVKLN